VPAQHGLGCHREGSPLRAWQQPGQRRQQQPVPAVMSWPGHLPAQHRQLVPQYQELHLLTRLAPAEQDHQFQHPTGEQVHHRQDHGRDAGVPRKPRSTGPINVFEPHRVAVVVDQVVVQ
jgi:hypothetical protein